MLEQDALELKIVSGDFMFLRGGFFDVSVVDLFIFLLDLLIEVRSKSTDLVSEFQIKIVDLPRTG